MTEEMIVDVLGWVGAILLLTAYGLVSASKLSGKSNAYQAFNVAGSVFLIINSIFYGALPSVGVNVVWICIGLMTIIQNLKAGRITS